MMFKMPFKTNHLNPSNKFLSTPADKRLFPVDEFNQIFSGDYKSVWECHPIPESLIKRAIELEADGMRSVEIFKKLKLQRSCMLYWMREYKQGRRWGEDPIVGLDMQKDGFVARCSDT